MNPQSPNLNKLSNYIIGVLGKKGSGKSALVKRIIDRIDHVIIFDPMHEYGGVFYQSITELRNMSENIICESFIELVTAIKCLTVRPKYRIIFRAVNDDEAEGFMQIMNKVNNYTLVLEECDIYTDSHYIHSEISNLIKYGRHFNRSLIWVSRSPFEINRFLTRQTDILISFLQTEPRDIEYLSNFIFNKNIAALNYANYEYASWYSYPGAEQLMNNLL
jgi:hypothetical protein